MPPLPRRSPAESSRSEPPPTEEASWLRVENALRAALREIRYGSLELVIHAGRVVQIERREKLRWSEEREP
jgi:hypothetical protein